MAPPPLPPLAEKEEDEEAADVANLTFDPNVPSSVDLLAAAAAADCLVSNSLFF